MSTAIPIEVYEILEDKLGRENAHVITTAMENAAASIALQKKVEIRDELSKELASKSDLLAVKIELKSDMRMYFIILVAVIVITNPRALDLIAKLLGVVR